MDPREPARRPSGAWPAVVFDAPMLRELDARARREIAEAGRLATVAAGDPIYRAGDEGPSFFVVAEGRVTLSAVRRGDEIESELRVASAGESFGEESTIGLARRATATAADRALVAEIPLSVFRRAAARAGKAVIAARLERSLARAATADLLRTLAITRDLPARELDVLLDSVSLRRVERGEHVYRQGEPARDLFLCAEGMVQIQIEEDDHLRVLAYLGRGDFFGDMEITAGTARASSAVAAGPAVLCAVPARVLRDIAAAHPDLIPSLRRLAEDQEAAQRAVVGRAAGSATQHAFRDLYRLKVARSLLVIDLESCVRCGHCAWSCADTHGVARLTRRGDKMVTRMGEDEGGPPRHLMLPSSCQHCERPACMVDCPTGAIGRDPSGEVFIREVLCTGCGACARACPWDNIQMTPRDPARRSPSIFARGALSTEAPAPAEVAVKCDLCRGRESPECVTACPTGSIFRMNPAEEIADLRELFGGSARGSKGERRAPWLFTGAAIAAAGIAIAAAILQARRVVVPGRGIGLAAGIVAAVGMVALLGYAVPKRGIGRRRRGNGSGMRVEPQLRVHLAIGVVTAAVILIHAPLTGRAGSGTALLWAMGATSIAGALGAIAYRLIPPRLARIERSAALPEDFARAREDLEARLYREASGKSDLVKRLLEKILLPHARSALGPLSLITSGRSLREEEVKLAAHIDAVLEGRGKERLAGLSPLIRVAVEIRALPAQRLLLATLRAWLPLHIVTFAVALALLVVHVISALFRRG